MTTTLWKNMISQRPPADGTYWIRRLGEGVAAQGVWTVANEEWTLGSEPMHLPWYMVRTWRVL